MCTFNCGNLVEEDKINIGFTRTGDNIDIAMDFKIDRDASWTEILPMFIDFLGANGYLIPPEHDLYQFCDFTCGIRK